MTTSSLFLFVARPARLGSTRSRAGLHHHPPLTLGDAARIGARQNAPAIRLAIAPIRRMRASRRVAPIYCRPSRATRRRMAARTTPRRSASHFPASILRLGDRPGEHLRCARPHLGDLLDFGAIQRLKGARTTARAFGATAANEAESRRRRGKRVSARAAADAQLSARQADSVLADSLLGIASEELRAGVGVALDVTRAQSQSRPCARS